MAKGAAIGGFEEDVVEDAPGFDEAVLDGEEGAGEGEVEVTEVGGNRGLADAIGEEEAGVQGFDACFEFRGGGGGGFGCCHHELRTACGADCRAFPAAGEEVTPKGGGV